MFFLRSLGLAALVLLLSGCGKREGSSGNLLHRSFDLQAGGFVSRYLVSPKRGVAHEEVLHLVARTRGLSFAGQPVTYLASAFSASDYVAVGSMGLSLTVDEAERLRQSGLVKYVSPVKQMHMYTVQNNPFSWGLDRLDQEKLPLDSRFAYPASAGKGVWAFVIDTGIDGSHREFRGRVREGFTAINDGKGTFDCEGHGTHVSGTVAGARYGIAKLATIVPVRVLNCEGSASDEEVIAGIDWIVKQREANPKVPMVANMSLGGDPSQPFDDAVVRLINAGVVLAVAAGNDGEDACNNSPARVPQAITVGATENTDVLAYFSDFGPCVDIYAPGDGIYSAKPRNGAGTMSGTSMASPHVAGVAAVVLGLHPEWSVAEVEGHIKTIALKGKVGDVDPASAENLLLQVDKP